MILKRTDWRLTWYLTLKNSSTLAISWVSWTQSVISTSRYCVKITRSLGAQTSLWARRWIVQIKISRRSVPGWKPGIALGLPSSPCYESRTAAVQLKTTLENRPAMKRTTKRRQSLRRCYKKWATLKTASSSSSSMLANTLTWKSQIFFSIQAAGILNWTWKSSSRNQTKETVRFKFKTVIGLLSHSGSQVMITHSRLAAVIVWDRTQTSLTTRTMSLEVAKTWRQTTSVMASKII